MAYRLLLQVLLTRPLWRLAIIFSSLLATCFGLMGPFFQKEFIDALMQNQPAWEFLLVAVICLGFGMGLNMLSNFLGVQEALQMQKVFAHQLYQHTLKLRSDSLKGKPTGEIVSIYATDVPSGTAILDLSLPQGAGIIFPLILAPVVLVHFLHVPVIPIIVMMTAIVLLSFVLAFRQSVFFFQFKKLASDRIGLVNEWIQNIRALRILGWISSFEKKIFEVRKVETKNRIRMVTNGQTMNAISSSITFFLNIAAVGALVYFSEHPVTTGQLLAVLWIVAIFMTRSFRQLPWFFTFVFDSWTSLKRIQSILDLENKDAVLRKQETQKIQMDPQNHIALKIQGMDLKIAGQNLLKNIHLEIKQGEFVTIVGEVGSGKSLLLLSLLGETGADFKEYQVFQNDAATMPLQQLRQYYAYIPQEGFIMSASLRENVAFEYDIPKDFDQKILDSLQRSQFDLTRERVENGLSTEIGERGVNLSGGQKQRVSLARVDYYKAPIVLLDDCLSAVDVETENHLVNDLINSKWVDRTRILVTHRLSVLEKSDKTIFIQNGEILAQGKFSELLATNSQFRAFAATVAQDESRSLTLTEAATAAIPPLLPNSSSEGLEE